MTLVEGSPNSLSAVDAALKQIYEQSNESMLFFDERPAFGLIPKDESMAGRNIPLVGHFARTGGRSASFAKAQELAAARNKKIEDFLITSVDDYSLVRVPGKTLAFARSAEGAFDDLVASLAQKGFDDAEENLANAIDRYMYRDSLGWIAQVGSVNTSGTVTSGDAGTITLSDVETIYFFELQDYFQLSSTAGGTLESDVFMVHGVDTLNGKIGYTVISGSESNITTSDYIHLYGDGADNSTGLKISGFNTWIPTSVPSGGESFFGVDRSQHARLYGKYMDHSGISRSNALIRAATTLGKEGGAPTVALTHYTQQRILIEELGLMREYVDMNPVSERGLVANVGYRGVYVQGPHSVLRSVPVLNGISNEAVLLRPEDWKLLSAGPALSLEDYDGLSCLRLPTEDAYEGRMVFRGQLACKKPGRQGRVKFAAAGNTTT